MGIFAPVPRFSVGRASVCVFGAMVVASFSGSADAASALSLAEVVELARQQAPDVQRASFDVEAAKASRVGAEAYSAENPSLSAIAGPRFDANVVVDGQATVSVPLELGLRRGRALHLADADLDRERSALEGARRDAVVVAVARYLRALHARARVELAEQRLSIADKLQATAIERERVGDASRLEVNLARAERARGASAVADAQRAFGDAAAGLGDALGLAPQELVVDGSLAASSTVQALASATGLSPPGQAVVARAEVEAAGKDVALADTTWWPALSAQGQYSFDEGSHIAMAGVGLTLPLFDAGQQRRAEAGVRASRSQTILQLVEVGLQRERHRARLAYDRAAQAFAVLDEEGLPRALENDALVGEAYAAGKIDLPTLLLLQRDALATREEHLERLLERSLAALDVVAAGFTDTTIENGVTR